MSSRHLSIVAPLVLAGLACSSRPGNIVDVTPPTVVQRSPMPGASNVWVHDPIQVVFSEQVDKASAESDAAVVVTGQDGALLSKTLKLGDDGLTLTITLTATPPVPSAIKVALGDSITDQAGNHLTLPSEDWTLSLPDWQQPGGGAQALNTDTSITPGTAVALDGSGAPVVAWTDGLTLVVKRWDSSTQSWKALGTNPLNQNAGLRAYTPSLAVDASGNPYVAWVETSGDSAGTWLLWVKRWDPSAGDWIQVGGPLNRDPSQDALLRPSIAVAPDGPVVAWAERAAPAAQVYVSRFSGNAWIPVGTSPSSGTSVPADFAAVAIDPTVGRPLVVWTEQEPEVLGSGLSTTVSHARVARWTGSWQSGAWTPVGSLLNVGSPADARYPALAVDASGVPTVAWAEAAVGARATTVVYAKRASSSSWSLLGGGPLNTSGATEAGSVRIVLDAAGAPIVAFDEQLSSTGYSVLVKKLIGETWTPLGGILNMSTSTYAHMPSMVIDAGGVPVVAWIETVTADDTSSWNVWFKRYNQ